jgi:hypothetical protein
LDPLLVLLWIRSLNYAAGEGPPLRWLLHEIEAYARGYRPRARA